jgi:hypothetical protein
MDVRALLVGAVVPDHFERRQEGCRRMQIEEDAGEEPEVEPEDLVTRSVMAAPVTGARASATRRASARRRSFPYSEVMV